MELAVIVWGTLSIIELLWILIGVLALRFKIPNLKSARMSVQAVEVMNGKNVMGYPEARILARGRRRREYLRISMSGCIIAAGVISGFIPQSVMHLSMGAIVITIVFFCIEVIDTLQSAFDKHDADKLWKLGEREQRRRQDDSKHTRSTDTIN